MEYREVKGVGGWLLLFVIIIILFRPLILIYNILINYNTIINMANQYPFMLAFYVLGKSLSIIINLFGIYVAISLIKTKTNSPLMAKILILLILLETIVCSYIFPLFYGLPQDITHQLIYENIPASTGSLLFCIIWYLYFIKSIRIKDTFPCNNQSKNTKS